MITKHTPIATSVSNTISDKTIMASGEHMGLYFLRGSDQCGFDSFFGFGSTGLN